LSTLGPGALPEQAVDCPIDGLDAEAAAVAVNDKTRCHGEYSAC
jgi:hypothetical protein